jgi:hypothetical protein
MTSEQATQPSAADHAGKAFRRLRYLTSPERIANRVVADEYAAVSDKIDACMSCGARAAVAAGVERDRGGDPLAGVAGGGGA